MRIVVETNVFVSACIGKGFASSVVAAWVEGRVQPILGAALFLEYEDVLSRSEPFAKARLNAAERNLLLNVFASHCEWCRIYFRWRPNLFDEGDNHLVELAVAANAAYIVTSNERDLGSGDLRFEYIAVVSPEVFARELDRWTP